MTFEIRIKAILDELYPQGGYELSFDTTRKVAIVTLPQGGFYFFLETESDEAIRDELRDHGEASSGSDLPSDEDLKEAGDPSVFHTSAYAPLTAADRDALEFAKKLQSEVEIYRNIGAFLIGLLVLALPALVDWAGTKATNEAMQHTMDWHQNMEKRMVLLEKDSDFKSHDRQLKEQKDRMTSMQAENQLLKLRLDHLEKHSVLPQALK